ncbi:SDR family NAD(P)-dependent oxidoreductase [Alteromonas confluentis]|nr:SDR family NAD(P)-dependent oxidoreductase [Alteromonas confluentis]
MVEKVNPPSETTPMAAVITGGSSGLGFATAQRLCQHGYRVALFDINQDAGSEAAAKLGPLAHFFGVDVCDEHQVAGALAEFKQIVGHINLCVNCAGIAPAKRLLNRDGEAVALSHFTNVININLIGTFNVARLVAKTMAAQQLNAQGERGVIINTASIAGFEGQIGQTAYASSKAAIIGLTLPMARDLSASAIRVNAIAPGIMGTPMLLAMPEEVQSALAANVPFPKRLGLPEEFAHLVMHIAANSYINGETIRLDGALRMPPK